MAKKQPSLEVATRDERRIRWSGLTDADAYAEAKKAEALDWEAKANAAKAAHDAYKAALAG